MKEEDLIILAADMVLSKYIMNDPFDFKGSFPYWIREHDKAEIFTYLIRMPNDYFYNEVHGFLLKMGYIGRWQPGREEKFLTEIGNKAKICGGHYKYLEWVAEQEVKQKLEDFPKKKWFIYDPVKIILAYIVPIFISGIIGYFIGVSKKSGGETKKPRPNKDQSLPKILDKKDTSL